MSTNTEGITENYTTDNYSQYAAVYNLIEAHNSLDFIDPNQVIDNKLH